MSIKLSQNTRGFDKMKFQSIWSIQYSKCATNDSIQLLKQTTSTLLSID